MDPSRLYYGTDTRATGLLVGSRAGSRVDAGRPPELEPGGLVSRRQAPPATAAGLGKVTTPVGMDRPDVARRARSLRRSGRARLLVPRPRRVRACSCTAAGWPSVALSSAALIMALRLPHTRLGWVEPSGVAAAALDRGAFLRHILVALARLYDHAAPARRAPGRAYRCSPCAWGSRLC